MTGPATAVQLCIIADDLTGALDAAAPFAGRGLGVRVALSPEAFPEALAEAMAAGAEVVSVSTRSRDGDEAAARAAMAPVLAALPSGIRVMKKIDSRLKGHVAAELSMLDPARLLVAPALPEFGRVTRQGAVQGFGVETPIMIRDRLGPIADRAIIPDVETPEQMRAALQAAPPTALLVGARGLAVAVAIAMTGRAEAVPVYPRADRSLMVVGSQDPITVAQAKMVAAGLTHVLAPLGDLADVDAPARADHVLVQATPGTDLRTGDAVARALALGIHPRLTAARDAILLTGGATAEAVLSEMGVTVLDLRGECLPGLPVAFAQDRCIIAKSGGFGDETALVATLAMFRGN